ALIYGGQGLDLQGIFEDQWLFARAFVGLGLIGFEGDFLKSDGIGDDESLGAAGANGHHQGADGGVVIYFADFVPLVAVNLLIDVGFGGVGGAAGALGADAEEIVGVLREPIDGEAGGVFGKRRAADGLGEILIGGPFEEKAGFLGGIVGPGHFDLSGRRRRRV